MCVAGGCLQPRHCNEDSQLHVPTSPGFKSGLWGLAELVRYLSHFSTILQVHPKVQEGRALKGFS